MDESGAGRVGTLDSWGLEIGPESEPRENRASGPILGPTSIKLLVPIQCAVGELVATRWATPCTHLAPTNRPSRARHLSRSLTGGGSEMPSLQRRTCKPVTAFRQGDR